MNEGQASCLPLSHGLHPVSRRGDAFRGSLARSSTFGMPELTARATCRVKYIALTVEA